MLSRPDRDADEQPKRYFFCHDGEFVEVPSSVVVSIQADTLAAMRSWEESDE
jgi:hypothetical protein